MKIEFTKEEKDQLSQKIQNYFEEELTEEIGNLGSLLLLDFIAENIGIYYYNQGLRDAQKVLEQKFEDLRDALYSIEQPIHFKR